MRTRPFLIALLVLAAGAAAYLGGSAIFDTRLSAYLPQNGGVVGAFGPIELTFDRPMDEASVSAALHLQPALPGRLAWDGNTARFVPSQSMQAGTRYTVRLDASARSAQERPLAAAAQWSFQVREPWVVYLSPAGGPGELYRINPGGGAPLPLTSTGSAVSGFAASNQGDEIVYSVRRAGGGSNLWEIGRDGQDPHLLVACAPDLCQNAAWSPDGFHIAYSRTPAGGQPRIWTVDALSGHSAPLYPDPTVHGQDPAWSPDGTRLAFYDLGQRGIRLIDLTNSAQTLIATRQETTPTWTPDGRHLIYDEVHPGVESPADQVLAYDVTAGKAGEAAPLLGKTADAPDYGLPSWSADGKWIAVGIRDVGGSPARQLWLLHGDGTPIQAITADPLSNAAAPRWDPWGQRLVFQRFHLGTSESQPEIVLWDRASQTLRVLAKNASSPVWVP